MRNSTLGKLGILAATVTVASGCGADQSSGTSDAPADGYVAGTYTVVADYANPDGETGITVEATIDDEGTLDAVTVTPGASSGNGLLFQEAFASAIAAEVVGKPIHEIDVSKVAGASLTSTGFNSAIAEIVAQAAK